jgi:hypothetical protein
MIVLTLGGFVLQRAVPEADSIGDVLLRRAPD